MRPTAPDFSPQPARRWGFKGRLESAVSCARVARRHGRHVFGLALFNRGDGLAHDVALAHAAPQRSKGQRPRDHRAPRARARARSDTRPRRRPLRSRGRSRRLHSMRRAFDDGRASRRPTRAGATHVPGRLAAHVDVPARARHVERGYGGDHEECRPRAIRGEVARRSARGLASVAQSVGAGAVAQARGAWRTCPPRSWSRAAWDRAPTSSTGSGPAAHRDLLRWPAAPKGRYTAPDHETISNAAVPRIGPRRCQRRRARRTRSDRASGISGIPGVTSTPATSRNAGPVGCASHGLTHASSGIARFWLRSLLVPT